MSYGIDTTSDRDHTSYTIVCVVCRRCPPLQCLRGSGIANIEAWFSLCCSGKTSCDTLYAGNSWITIISRSAMILPRMGSSLALCSPFLDTCHQIDDHAQSWAISICNSCYFLTIFEDVWLHTFSPMFILFWFFLPTALERAPVSLCAGLLFSTVAICLSLIASVNIFCSCWEKGFWDIKKRGAIEKGGARNQVGMS